MARSNAEPVNPANELEIPDGFRPMTHAMQKLEVPQRPGYNRHWFRGNPGRISAAMRAGYRYIENDDVTLNNFDLGGDARSTGNTDLGNRVSRICGEGLESDGQPSRLYLMECPNHLFALSQKVVADSSEATIASLRGGMVEASESAADKGARYVKGSLPDMFNPNKRNPGA